MKAKEPRLTKRDVQILINALLVASSRADSQGKHKRAQEQRNLGCKLLQMKVAQ